MTFRSAQLARFTFFSLCAGIIVFSGVCHAYAGYMRAAAERGWPGEVSPRRFVQPVTTFTTESPEGCDAKSCPMTTTPTNIPAIDSGTTASTTPRMMLMSI